MELGYNEKINLFCLLSNRFTLNEMREIFTDCQLNKLSEIIKEKIDFLEEEEEELETRTIFKIGKEILSFDKM